MLLNLCLQLFNKQCAKRHLAEKIEFIAESTYVIVRIILQKDDTMTEL